ncbi:hypothetical protein BDR03DRAFT_960568, partial [Suillus americanus]
MLHLINNVENIAHPYMREYVGIFATPGTLMLVTRDGLLAQCQRVGHVNIHRLECLK